MLSRMQFISPYVERDVLMKFTAATTMNWMFKKQDGCLQFSIRKAHYTSYRKMFPFPIPFSAFMPSPSCISMKIKIKWLLHYTSSTVEALPCLGTEETAPEAELLRHTESAGHKAAVTADRMETECAGILLWVGRRKGKKEKRYVACTSPQNLSQVSARQIQGTNGKANTTSKEAEFCWNYRSTSAK